MVDTTVPAVAVNLVTTAASTTGVVIFGVATGLDYPTLLAGVLGGGLALSYSTKVKVHERVLEVVTASLLAGYAAPAADAIITALLAKIHIVIPGDVKLLQLLSAVAIGYLAHGVLLPGLRKMGGSFMRRHSDE